MRLWLDGSAPKSAVEQIMLTLFPSERPEYVASPALLGENGARISLKAGEKYLTATTVLYRGGSRHVGAARRAVGSGMTELERGKAEKGLVKKSFYKAAVALSGRRPPWGMLTGIRPTKISTDILDRGGTSEQARALLQRRYEVSPERAGLCVRSSEAGVKVKRGVRDEDISLYVGIPFCPTRCAYCSFVSNSVEKSAKLIEPYLDALEREICAAAELVSKLGLSVKTVYFGGGTPTTLSTSQLERLMGSLAAAFDLSGVEEYTVEAGRPDTVQPDKLAALKENGVTRVSINPQTMVDSVLETIGRRHSAADVERAYRQAREAGFECINMDLIAGLPSDDTAGFKYSLDAVMALEPENITVHTLALKKGSRLRLQNAPIPSAEAVSDMLDYALGRLTAAEYAPYYLYRQKFMAGSFENVGWSLKGCECLYNIYIMEELHTILSLGAGGATKLVDPRVTRIERIFNPKYPYEYIANLDKLIEAKKYMLDYYERNIPHAHKT